MHNSSAASDRCLRYLRLCRNKTEYPAFSKKQVPILPRFHTRNMDWFRSSDRGNLFPAEPPPYAAPTNPFPLQMSLTNPFSESKPQKALSPLSPP